MAERARWDPPWSPEEGEPRRGPRSLSQHSSKTAGKMYPQVSPVRTAAGHCSSLLPLENNRPELGARRLPALLGRGRRGAGEPCGAGEKLPGRAHLWRSFYSYRPLLPPLATSSLRGKNFAAPKINLTQMPAPGRGAGARGRAPSPAGAHPPREAPAFPRQREADTPPFPRGAPAEVRSRAGAKSVAPETRPEAGERGAASPGRAGGAAPGSPPFPGAFSFANELPGRPSGTGAGGAAGSGHPLPTPEADLFPPQKPPRSGAGHCGAPTASRRPAAGPGEGG